jgi:hypothetical protein
MSSSLMSLSLNAILTPIPCSESIEAAKPLKISTHELNERHFELLVSKRWQNTAEFMKALTAHVYFICAFLPNITRPADRLKALRLIIEQASEVIADADDSLKAAINKLHEVCPRWEWMAALV